MDQNSTFYRVADASIKDLAKGVRPSLREDFCQDMWLHLLNVGAHTFYKGRCGTRPETLSNMSAYINLLVFRARYNWLRQKSMKCLERGIPTDPEVLERIASRDLNRQAGAKHDAEVAVNQLCRSLADKFSESEIDAVLEGLMNGDDLAQIARRLDRSPQAFHYYFVKTREAA